MKRLILGLPAPNSINSSFMNINRKPPRARPYGFDIRPTNTSDLCVLKFSRNIIQNYCCYYIYSSRSRVGKSGSNLGAELKLSQMNDPVDYQNFISWFSQAKDYSPSSSR